jgi:hypothetical protein
VKAEPDIKGSLVVADAPACPLGGQCDLATRESVYGWQIEGGAGIAQCRRCSTVYETTGWRPRQCSSCGLLWGQSTHDPCIGQLDGTFGACCGHGDPARRYGIPGED